MAGDRPVFWWEVSTPHWSSACDIGCSSETGWGSASGASGCAAGNGGETDPYHSLGCLISAGSFSARELLLTEWLRRGGERFSFYCGQAVRFDQGEGVFWEATVVEAVDIVWSYIPGGDSE